MKILLALFHLAIAPEKGEGLIGPLVAAALFAAFWLRWLWEC